MSVLLIVVLLVYSFLNSYSNMVVAMCSIAKLDLIYRLSIEEIVERGEPHSTSIKYSHTVPVCSGFPISPQNTIDAYEIEW